MSSFRLRDERGQVLVITALFMGVLLLIAAFSIAAGSWKRDNIRLQNAAEAAAVAGARTLTTPLDQPGENAAATAAATSLADQNLSLPVSQNGGGGTSASTPSIVVSSSSGGGYDTVKVSLADTKPAFLGWASSNGPQTAVAQIQAVTGLNKGAIPLAFDYKDGNPATNPNWGTNETYTLTGGLAPGAFQALDFGCGNGQPQNCVPDPNPIGLGPAKSNPGNGAPKKILDAVATYAAANGGIIYIPLYCDQPSCITGSGNNAQYQIVGFGAFVVQSVDTKGSTRSITGHFTSVVTSVGGSSQPAGGQTNYGLQSIKIIG